VPFHAVDRSVQTDARAEPARPEDGTASGALVIAAVVLTAGASSRFGSPKQQLLVEPIVERVRRSSVDDVVVVLGAHPVETSVRSVRCDDWERGPGASLRCGLAALGEAVEAAVVVLGDGPTIDPRAIDRVIDSWRATGAERIGATYGGVRLHPLLLARSAWAEIPDAGLRALPAELVACDDLEAPGDVDFADEWIGSKVSDPDGGTGGRWPPNGTE
jgi:CTP:molybdopterin cytidylyltransferase MocA